MEAVAQRKLIKTVRETPTLAKAFKVPLLALPTFFLTIASLGGFTHNIFIC